MYHKDFIIAIIIKHKGVKYRFFKVATFESLPICGVSIVLYPFHNTAVVGSLTVGPVNLLTTSAGWLQLLQLTVLSRSTIAV